jgi:16S rRNA (guanine1516-N2)-methyltransferase
MIITTSVHPSPSLIEKAQSMSAKYGIEYFLREKKSVEYFHQHVDNDVFVVNNMRGVSFYKEESCECFFHLNMAYHRLINLKRLA